MQRTAPLAFPTARGAGAYTKGGSGGSVYVVTNLNDDGPGSFRDALRQSNCTVVFAVSGVINLSSIIVVSGEFLTIAGQTAPAGGITIDGARVYFENARQIICRYIRFRGGVDETSPAATGNDSLSAARNIRDHILDHCSFSFGADEAASWYATKAGDTIENITIQNCFFSESLKGAIIGGQSGFATSDNISFINNLFYNCSYRFPNIAGDNCNIDVINNAVWKADDRLIRGNGSFNLLHIGNYYNFGATPIKNQSLNLYAFNANHVPTIYTANNKIVAPNTTSPLTNSVSEMNANNQLMWKFFQNGGGYAYGDQLPSNYFTGTQRNLVGAPFEIVSPDQALQNVLADVGCNLYLSGSNVISSLDSLDTTWLSNINQGLFTPKLNRSEYQVPSFTSISRSSGYDSNNDGIPDAVAQEFGYGPNEDIANLLHPSGYTLLEVHINRMDQTYTPIIPLTRPKRLHPLINYSL